MRLRHANFLKGFLLFFFLFLFFFFYLFIYLSFTNNLSIDKIIPLNLDLINAENNHAYICFCVPTILKGQRSKPPPEVINSLGVMVRC